MAPPEDVVNIVYLHFLFLFTILFTDSFHCKLRPLKLNEGADLGSHLGVFVDKWADINRDGVAGSKDADENNVSENVLTFLHHMFCKLV